jgi:hypothetical protein
MEALTPKNQIASCVVIVVTNTASGTLGMDVIRNVKASKPPRMMVGIKHLRPLRVNVAKRKRV